MLAGLAIPSRRGSPLSQPHDITRMTIAMIQGTTTAKVALVAAIAFVGVMTLWPDPKLADLAASTPWWCLVCGDLGTVDVLMNVLLFVPVGVACYGLGWRAGRTLLVALGTSFLVESLQLAVIPGRDASLSDLITNTGGALTGFWFMAHHRYWLLPTPIVAVRLQRLGLLGWLVLTILTAWGLEPVVSARPLFGQWAPRFSHMDAFTGRVDEASSVGSPLPNGPYADDDPVRQRLRSGQMSLRASIITGPAPSGRAPIVALADDRPTTILRLTQNGDALVFTAVTRSWRAQLRPPSIRITGALPKEPGINLVVGGVRSRRTISVWAMTGDQRLEASLSVSPNWSWLLVSPFNLSAGPETPFLTGLWLAMLLLPLGYWSARASPTTRGTSWPLLVLGLVAGLVVIPMGMGLERLAWPEVVGAIAGSGTGIGLAALSLRHEL